MQTNFLNQGNIYHEPHAIAREIKRSCPNYTASKTSGSIPSTHSNQCLEISRYILSKAAVRQENPERTFLVDKKSNSLQWMVPKFTITRSTNDNGCFNKVMMNIMSGFFNKPFLVDGGTKAPYLCVRAERGQTGSVDLQKI